MNKLLMINMFSDGVRKQIIGHRKLNYLVTLNFDNLLKAGKKKKEKKNLQNFLDLSH
jgi:hypothetical protein